MFSNSTNYSHEIKYLLNLRKSVISDVYSLVIQMSDIEKVTKSLFLSTATLW